MKTIYGEMHESLLHKSDGRRETDDEIETWQEWTLDGEVVRRDAQVQLQRWPSAESAASLGVTT